MITLSTIKYAGVDPVRAGFARFIPAEGLSPRDFLNLPLQPYLDHISRTQSAAEISLRIFLSSGFITNSLLHETMLFMGRLALPVLESYYPNVDLPERAIELKAAWLLQGEVNLENIKDIHKEMGLFHAGIRNRGRAAKSSARAIWLCASPQPIPSYFLDCAYSTTYACAWFNRENETLNPEIENRRREVYEQVYDFVRTRLEIANLD